MGAADYVLGGGYFSNEDSNTNRSYYSALAYFNGINGNPEWVLGKNLDNGALT